MTITQLGDRIAELAARINIATYEMLTLIAEFDRREGWADAFTSCAEWLAWRTGRMIGTCRENVRVAHALEGLPKISAEMKAGRLSYTKVRAITRAATKETEARLLKYADKCSAMELERIVRGWKHLSRDGELTAEEVRHQRRTLSVVIDADGTYVVRGRLEPEAGAVLMRAIEAATDALYRGEDPDARPTRRQRRADAAGLVAERALAAGFGADADEAVQSGTRAERYQVTVHTEMSTLQENGEGGRSELDGVRVSAETSRRMSCDASVVHMLHRDGQVVSVGRKTRTIPPHLRRALEERDRGCRYPGCGSRFTEAHHVKHWADGGETSLANTVLLCRRHHRLVHEGGVRMALDAKGQAVFFTRDGKMLASVPPSAKEPKLTPNLPPAPSLRPGQMYNGAARLANGAVPWEIEAAAREAVEEALEKPALKKSALKKPALEDERPARAEDGATAPGPPPAFPRQNQGPEHVAMGQAAATGQAAAVGQPEPEEVKNGPAEECNGGEASKRGRERAA